MKSFVLCSSILEFDIKCFLIQKCTSWQSFGMYLEWNLSKPATHKPGLPCILAYFSSPCGTFLCKGSLIKPATPLNQPFLLVPVLTGLEKFYCISICKNSAFTVSISYHDYEKYSSKEYMKAIHQGMNIIISFIW
jgi:hypothetical protein